MKNEIINLSKKLNIDLIGFTDLKCDESLKYKYELQDTLGYKTTFQTGTIEDKLLSSSKYDKYNSVIVIGVSYKKVENNNIHLSSCSYETDYHIVLKDKLNVIGNYLEKNGYIFDIFVDNNSLDERYLAYKAGLGFFGKNNLLINEKYGSCFFIGVILTNFICEYDKPLLTTCIGCNKCIESCPNKALNENGILDSNKCLSYINQKKTITENEKKLLNNCVYGCDKCIDVCPYNRNIEIVNNDIETNFLEMTIEEYNEKYSNRACYWRGKKVIDRNIEFYLKNKKECYNKLNEE